MFDYFYREPITISMMEDLIKSMFYKAELSTGKSGNKAAASKNIHKWILENIIDKHGRKVSISVKTLERTYDQYILEKEEAQLRGEPGGDKLNYFSQYLGYEDYSDFIQQNSSGEKSKSIEDEKESVTNINAIITESVESKTITTDNYYEKGGDTTIINNPSHNPKKGRFLLILSIFTAVVVVVVVVVTILLISFWSKDDQLCLVWRQNHYEQISCEEITSSDITISVDEKDWSSDYKDFKKITINQSTPLINSSGKPMVWYQYYHEELEFYNAEGRHPITGKDLKPITYEIAKEYFEETLEKKQSETLKPTVILPSTGPSLNDLPEEDSETPVATGKYCFKNTGSEYISVTLTSSSKSEKLELKPNEQICIYLPIGYYKYRAVLRQDNSVIGDGEIEFTENQVHYLNLSRPIKEVVPTEPEKECLTGNFKVINNSNEKIEVRLSDFGVHGPLATFYKTIHINAGKTGNFFAIKGGVYVINVTKSDDFTKTENMNIQIENCKTNETTID